MNQEKLSNLINVVLELTQIGDEDILLEKILLEARRLTNADAGSVYVKEGKNLLFKSAQNDTLSRSLPPGKKLIYSAFYVPIDHNSIAGYVASVGESLNIPDVYNLPSSVPYSFSKYYDEISNYHTKSMVAIPLKTNQNRLIGVLQLINAKDDSGEVIEFSNEDIPYIKHFAILAATSLERAQLIRTAILRMISMAQLRDPEETGAHANRVGAYSIEIYETWAHKKGVSHAEIERKKDILRMAAMLHDVGKIAIPDAILKKSTKFTNDEFAIMKTHTTVGAQLFNDANSEMEKMVAEIALSHHERWDGSGYPYGLKGNKIPLMGRIVAVADVYDALCSKRSYKDAINYQDVCKIIREDSGKYFDPDIVEAFFESLDVLREVGKRYQDVALK